MKTLIKYEIKKIIIRKSTWIAFFAIILLQTIVAFSGNLGATYVEDTFVETHAERNKIDRQYGLELSGRTMDEELFSEFRSAYSGIDMSENSFLLSREYQTRARPYASIYEMLSAAIGVSGMDMESINAESFYQGRRQQQEMCKKKFELSKTEKNYWQKKEEALPKEFTYQYATAYEYMVDMDGGYMSSLLITFFLAVCMGNVFAQEQTLRTDQLILCTRHGRVRLYTAKILAGGFVAFCAAVILVGICLSGRFISYGTEGFDAAVQLTNVFWYPYSISVGEVLLVMLGILFLSSVLIGVFVMVLTEITKNSTLTMAVVVGGLFMSRLVIIPVSFGVFSKLWNLIPINLLKVDQGFTDLRLVSVGGLKLTLWQFAPILYVGCIAALFFIGEYVYCRTQIKGR